MFLHYIIIRLLYSQYLSHSSKQHYFNYFRFNTTVSNSDLLLAYWQRQKLLNTTFLVIAPPILAFSNTWIVALLFWLILFSLIKLFMSTLGLLFGFLPLLLANSFLLTLDLFSDSLFLLLLDNFSLLVLGLSLLVALKERKRDIRGQPRQIFWRKWIYILVVAKSIRKKSWLKTEKSLA